MGEALDGDGGDGEVENAVRRGRASSSKPRARSFFHVGPDGDAADLETLGERGAGDEIVLGGEEFAKDDEFGGILNFGFGLGFGKAEGLTFTLGTGVCMLEAYATLAGRGGGGGVGFGG